MTAGEVRTVGFGAVIASAGARNAAIAEGVSVEEGFIAGRIHRSASVELLCQDITWLVKMEPSLTRSPLLILIE